MAARNSLLLRDREFRIANATITAGIADPIWASKYERSGNHGLLWCLSVETKQKTVDGEVWRPRIYIESLALKLQSWKEIAGTKVEWSKPWNNRTGEPNGCFYVFEHEDIPRAKLEFLRRKGRQFQIKWTGRCNVFWDKKFGKNVPFAVETWATFKGIFVAGNESDNPASVRARLSRHIDVSEFKQGTLKIEQTRYQYGKRMASAHFTPSIKNCRA